MFGFFKKKDDIIKDPIRPVADTTTSGSGSGVMTVDDVFSIAGRGTVATGRIEEGSFRIGDTVIIRKADDTVINTEITGIETFRKSIDMAVAGDNVGLLLAGVDRDQIERGDEISNI